MKLLVTNDDGIDAPGLAALAEAVADLGEVDVLAPQEHHSGCSHQATTRRPLSLTQVADRRQALDGTPADCTRIGLTYVVPDADWVLSGINDGGNLGVDVYMSGTVAAVREAALLGKPAIAFSQYHRRGDDADLDWLLATEFAARAFEQIRERPHEPGSFYNVNFPDPGDVAGEPEIIFCPLEAGHLSVRYELHEGRYHYRSDYHGRPREEGSDVDVCFSGNIAVTHLHPFRILS